MVDYHVHPNYSLDAEGSVADYCRQALAVGLEEICFTPHLEIDPVRAALDDNVLLEGKLVRMRSHWLDFYFKAVEQARCEFAPLEIRAGLEVGYDPRVEGELRDLLDRHPFDYVLGSIHCIDHVSITSRNGNDFYFAKAPVEDAAEGYLNLLFGAIESGIFDAIGHIDVFKKFGNEKYGTRLIEEIGKHWPNVFTSVMSRAPLVIEINVSGLRHAPQETYPSESVLRVAKSIGLKAVTLGSDAHRLLHLGQGLDKGYALAKAMGFRIARYKQRKQILE